MKTEPCQGIQTPKISEQLSQRENPTHFQKGKIGNIQRIRNQIDFGLLDNHVKLKDQGVMVSKS